MATLEQRAQAPQQTNPETENTSAVPSAEKSKLGKYGLASGALLGLGGIITGAVVGLSGDKEPSNSHETGSRPVATSEIEVKAKTYFPTEMLSVQSEFDSQRQAILDKILDLFAKDNFTMENYHMYEGRSIELASPTMSPVAILDRNAAKATFLTTNPDMTEALSQIGFAARPGTSAYQNFHDAITTAHAPGGLPSADEDILIQSKYFDHGAFVDTSGNVVVEADDTPTQVISAMSQRERTNTVFTFQWDQTADGNGGDWRVISAANEEGDVGYVDPLAVDKLTIIDTN